MSEYQHAFGQVSGLRLDEAACVAQRWEADAPFAIDTGESHVFEKRGKGAAVSLPTPGRFSGLWRAASGEIFVTHQGGAILWRLEEDAGEWEVFNVRGALSGVWGLDGHDLVFAWGVARGQGVMFRRRDNEWDEIPSPPEPVLGMHGIHPDLICAVGRGGSISRFTGRGWTAIARPVSGALGSIFVVSEDEMYACGPDLILEGSIDGWTRRGPFEYPVHRVAKIFGHLWVGAGRSGLHRLDPGATELTPVKPNVIAYHLDAREELLVSGDTLFAGTADGVDFIGQPIDAYARLASVHPPSWRS